MKFVLFRGFITVADDTGNVSVNAPAISQPCTCQPSPDPDDPLVAMRASALLAILNTPEVREATGRAMAKATND